MRKLNRFILYKIIDVCLILAIFHLILLLFAAVIQREVTWFFVSQLIMMCANLAICVVAMNYPNTYYREDKQTTLG